MPEAKLECATKLEHPHATESKRRPVLIPPYHDPDCPLAFFPALSCFNERPESEVQRGKPTSTLESEIELRYR